MAAPVQNLPVSPPRISVVTIVRNGEQFVGQAIESVLKQRRANIEYVVIDGGSTDRTVDIIKSHASGISRWISERDRGIADAFNKGVALSTGDYVLFLNADDTLADAEVIENITAAIVANDFPDLLYGDCNIVDRCSGEVLHRTDAEVSRKALLRGQMIRHSGLFTHRSYFEKYGRFDPDFRIGMDYEWLLRGALAVRTVHVPVLVTNMRAGGVSTVNRDRVVDEIVLALRKNGYLSSRWSEIKLRAYYGLRKLAKSALDRAGLYRTYWQYKNKRRDRNPE